MSEKKAEINGFNGVTFHSAVPPIAALHGSGAPAERGRGIARELLARHLGRLAALGIARVFLEVDDGNRPALQLYARAGFREVGRRAGYYARAEGSGAALTLRRDLV